MGLWHFQMNVMRRTRPIHPCWLSHCQRYVEILGIIQLPPRERGQAVTDTTTTAHQTLLMFICVVMQMQPVLLYLQVLSLRITSRSKSLRECTLTLQG